MPFRTSHSHSRRSTCTRPAHVHCNPALPISSPQSLGLRLISHATCTCPAYVHCNPASPSPPPESLKLRLILSRYSHDTFSLLALALHIVRCNPASPPPPPETLKLRLISHATPTILPRYLHSPCIHALHSRITNTTTTVTWGCG